MNKIEVDPDMVFKRLDAELLGAGVRTIITEDKVTKFIEEQEPVKKILNDPEWIKMLINFVFNMQSDKMCRDCLLA